MQVLGKSCKMVPVMLFGILIAGKAKDYSISDYLQVPNCNDWHAHDFHCCAM